MRNGAGPPIKRPYQAGSKCDVAFAKERPHRGHVDGDARWGQQAPSVSPLIRYPRASSRSFSLGLVPAFVALRRSCERSKEAPRTREGDGAKAAGLFVVSRHADQTPALNRRQVVLFALREAVIPDDSETACGAFF